MGCFAAKAIRTELDLNGSSVDPEIALYDSHYLSRAEVGA